MMCQTQRSPDVISGRLYLIRAVVSLLLPDFILIIASFIVRSVSTRKGLARVSAVKRAVAFDGEFH